MLKWAQPGLFHHRDDFCPFGYSCFWVKSLKSNLRDYFLLRTCVEFDSFRKISKDKKLVKFDVFRGGVE